MDPAAFVNLLKCRRSVRRYDPRPVEPDKVRLILESARWAPSSCNTQPWHIVVADRPALVLALSRCAPFGTRINKWMQTAPLVLVISAKPHPLLHKAAGWVDSDNHRIDIGIAGEHMSLMATCLGLGSCWIGWFSEAKVRRLLGIPDPVHVLALLVVGYPAGGIRLDEPAPVELRRKPLRDICSHNRFGQYPEEGGPQPW